MKRIVASVGLAALGAASVDSLHAQAVTADKPWSVSASLRGFYDDNVGTVNRNKRESFGFEVTPSLSLDLQGDQTSASLTYTYGFKWYDKKPDLNRSQQYDQTHTVAARLIHSFTERTSLSVADSFVIGQEPDVIRSGNFYTTVQRISGDNISNHGSITVNHQFSEKFGIEVGYANTFADYDSSQKNTLAPGNTPITFVESDPINNPGVFDQPTVPFVSNSGLLDRIEHSAHIDARWTVQPTTVALVGYMYSFVNYIGDEPIGAIGVLPNAHIFYSKERNSRSHYGYVGVEHSFRADFSGSIRAGARATDYYKSLDKTSDIGPYVSASLRYVYAQGSDLTVGVSHDRHATDLFSVSGASITTDAESTSAYISILHRIFPDLTANAMFTFQNSSFDGGSFNNNTEQYYLFNVGLEYHINRHFSASVSYNYDLLESDIRNYDRNRIYAGVSFVY